MSIVNACGMVLSKVTHNGLRLGEGGDHTTNVNRKHALKIYEKLSQ